jgi:hypothetical protein
MPVTVTDTVWSGGMKMRFLLARLMKFNNQTDEEICAEDVSFKSHVVICLRTKGHEGEHVSLMRDAAIADGVKHCCRTEIEDDHADWCETKTI